MVHIRSAQDGHFSIQQGAGNQRCSQTTGADKNILKTMAAYTTGAGSTPAVFRQYEGHVGKLRQCPAERLPEVIR